MPSPRILIAGPARQREYLATYCRAIELAGGTPLVAWPDEAADREPAEYSRFLEMYDGMVLPGGVDVHPSGYGEQPHERLGRTESDLDVIQIALAAAALRSGWPTLAICRGAQVLAVAAGGSLYQDLPSQRPSTVDHEVRVTQDALAHWVELDAESRCARAVDSTRFQVNSRHHQAARAADGGGIGQLRIVGLAPDGVVEAIEDPAATFVIGVQWHPENLVSSSAEASRLFRSFIVACG